jgi:endonuclease/exonuclease/phosphatase family metal-dependent hydrolase
MSKNHRPPTRPASASAVRAVLIVLTGLSAGCAELNDGAGTDTSASNTAAVDVPDGVKGASSGGSGSDTSGATGNETDAKPTKTQRIRVVAANVSSGKKQSYDPGHGKRILQGLKPDIVLIQEFNIGNNGVADVKAFVAETFGADFTFYREVGPAGSAIPNGVISRFPILASGSWDDSLSNNREFAWARIDVPGDKDLWAVSLHLLTSKSSARAKQIKQIAQYIQDNVPTGDLLVVGGDLNTNTVSEASLKGFNGVLVRKQQPADQSGNGDTNAPRNKPYDRLFADDDLHGLAVPVKIGAQSFTHGLVFDSRVYTPLADVAPVLKNDSDAESMQHMAVVRDFALPVSAP